MKNFVQNVILVLVLTILLLYSYSFLESHSGDFGLKEFYQFLTNGETEHSSDSDSVQDDMKDGVGGNGAISDGSNSDASAMSFKAVWLSYLEFNAYRRSVTDNNEEAFTEFFTRVLEHSRECDLNRIIVQVRPFGDALYASEYFPWAACISGTQGEDPGYDPLEIMVTLAHENDFAIEAWINPYRISSGSSLEELSEDNPARIWALSADSTRNVLTYDGQLYYNPSSKEVRELIIQGVQEIVTNYDVDGIHMDDYFYPVFTADNVDTDFDALEYEMNFEEGTIARTLSLADWRRQNVNELVSGLYATVNSINSNVTFGISPAGNLMNLRSDLENYVDIDTWISETGYIDYIMPQIYWGYSNTLAPFDEMLGQWCDLIDNSEVQLYIGLQLYRMGTSDTEQTDYEELQDATLIEKELEQIAETQAVNGYCFFSYQYLDVDNETYDFDSNEFSSGRKKILKKITQYLIE
ncbi:MAG: family 10 glycosylhydrolase [Clostridiales bacterium]|nr:family 10 glycosylhydrolase [Clostridiales bacterium]